jgi:hypothetical protein
MLPAQTVVVSRQFDSEPERPAWQHLLHANTPRLRHQCVLEEAVISTYAC